MSTRSDAARYALVLAVGLGGCWGGAVMAQGPSSESGAQHQASTPGGRVFGSDAGLVLNFVKADKAGDFEATITSLKEAFTKSESAERKQQAAGWKVFKAVEPGPNGSVLYIFMMDPVVKGADYAVAKILSEAFPQDVQRLYQTFAESYSGGQNVVNLTLVTAFGELTPR